MIFTFIRTVDQIKRKAIYYSLCVDFAQNMDRLGTGKAKAECVDICAEGNRGGAYLRAVEEEA